MTTGAVSREFTIKENGKIVDLTGAEQSIYNQIKRGDIEGVKISDGTHKRLADVPFRPIGKGLAAALCHRGRYDCQGQGGIKNVAHIV